MNPPTTLRARVESALAEQHHVSVLHVLSLIGWPYLAATRDRRPLRFTGSGDPSRERMYRTH